MESLDFSQEDLRFSNKEKQMQLGRKKFNMDPKKGKFSFILETLFFYLYNFIC